MASQNFTSSAVASPAGAPKLSRYLQRIERKRQRRLNPHPLTKRAQQRRCSAQSDNTRSKFAADDTAKGAK